MNEMFKHIPDYVILVVSILPFYIHPCQRLLYVQCSHSLQPPNMMTLFTIPFHPRQQFSTSSQTPDFLRSILIFYSYLEVSGIKYPGIIYCWTYTPGICFWGPKSTRYNIKKKTATKNTRYNCIPGTHVGSSITNSISPYNVNYVPSIIPRYVLMITKN